jgi:hypothetical protein
MFGVLGTLAALWVVVEALNASNANAGRTQAAGKLVAILMAITAFVGGYWYVRFYPPDRAMILKGPWPFAHNIFMEAKEHLFFVVLILSLYLPIAAGEKLYANASARKMVLCVASLIVLTDLVMEGSGAIINHGAKLAFRSAAGAMQII